MPHSVRAATNYCYRCYDDDDDVAYGEAAQCDAVAGDDAALDRMDEGVVGRHVVVVVAGPTTLDHRVATWSWIDVAAAAAVGDKNAFVHDGVVVVAVAVIATNHVLHADRMVVVVAVDDLHYAARCSDVAGSRSDVADAQMDMIACYHFGCCQCDCAKCCWLFVV